MAGYGNNFMEPQVVNMNGLSAYDQLARQGQGTSYVGQGQAMPGNNVGAGGIAGMNNNATGNSDGMGLGMNLGTARLALGGLQTIANIWAANRAYKLQKEQFAFEKDVTETNLMNSIQSYNTALGDRSYARAHMEGRDRGSAEQYTEENRMRRNHG